MSTVPSIEFFDGLSEELSRISLRRDRATGTRIVIMEFDELQAINRFNSFTKRFNQAILLRDEEGNIEIEPAGLQFIFGGPEGDDLQRVECKLELDREDHWERLMRFMHRYADANGMSYGEQ